MSPQAQQSIDALERLAALNLTMSYYAQQRGDTHGSNCMRLESTRIATLIAEIGKQSASAQPETSPQP